MSKPTRIRAAIANMVLAAILGACLSLPGADRARACAFHGYTPDPTLVDLLLITEQAVLARPSSSNPGRYTPVKTLLGPPVTELPLPVDPDAQARIRRTPSETVLLVRDGLYGPWIEILVLDDRFRALVERVMQRQSAWLYGNDADRLTLFAAHLDDPSPGIRRLALQELDRAPYAALQSLELAKPATLRQDLAQGEESLRPIRILLAGLSQDQSFAPYLTTELDIALKTDLPYTGAYATALIELKGAEAVEQLVARYLTSPGVPLTGKERLLNAMALQYKTAPTPTRRAIAGALAQLVRASPELGGPVARQFGYQGRGTLAAED